MDDPKTQLPFAEALDTMPVRDGQLSLWPDQLPSPSYGPEDTTVESVSLGLAYLAGKYALDPTLHSDESPQSNAIETEEQASTEVITAVDETNSTEVEQDNDEVDFDTYLTPEQRKKKATLGWLKDVLETYDSEVKSARQITKKSKRDKQRELADRRLKRKFETYGEGNQHIVYDSESLGYVLDDLAVTKPNVAKLVVDSSVEYLQTHSLEFAGKHKAFAGLVRSSLEGTPNATTFDRLITALYEKRDFVNNPLEAVSLQIALANIVFEVTDGSNLAYFNKILEIAYLKNDIVPNKDHYAEALNTLMASRIVKGSPDALIAESINARSTFSQAARAFGTERGYLDIFNSYGRLDGKTIRQSSILQRIVGVDHLQEYAETHRGDSLHDLTDDDSSVDFFMNPQHYDPVEVFDLKSGEHIPLPSDGKVIPERWRELYTGSDMYKKRASQLAPRAITRDMIASTLAKNGVDTDTTNFLDIPISPGITLSLAWFSSEVDHASAPSHVITRFMADYGHTIDYGQFDATENRLFGAGHQIVGLSGPDGEPRAAGFMVVRKSVPEDLKNAPKHTALSLSMLDRLHRYVPLESAVSSIDAKKDYIKQNRHNFFGRRPINFRLPDDLRERGLQSIEMRQHPDRKNVMVTARHNEGDVGFLFDADMNYLDGSTAHGHGPTALGLSLEDLVVSLAAEWACRPVVETSEGRISLEDNKSKVNLGFLRYLPPKFRFSDRQRRIFKREQHGNLEQESRRRKDLDPTGERRNSTYVRENYDPTRPPLEIYYDPSVL